MLYTVMQAAVTFIRDAFNDDGFAFSPIRASR